MMRDYNYVCFEGLVVDYDEGNVYICIGGIRRGLSGQTRALFFLDVYPGDFDKERYVQWHAFYLPQLRNYILKSWDWLRRHFSYRHNDDELFW